MRGRTWVLLVLWFASIALLSLESEPTLVSAAHNSSGLPAEAQAGTSFQATNETHGSPTSTAPPVNVGEP